MGGGGGEITKLMEHQNKAHKLGSTICSGFLASRQEET